MIFEILPLKKQIRATVSIPGSKSYTNRALVVASLANGKSIIKNASFSNDSKALIKALKKIGIKIKVNKTKIIIYGKGGKFKPYKGNIDVGAAGTTMRFLTALFACIEGSEIILRGTERMHQRPIKELVEALKSIGAKIKYLNRKGYPPLEIKGTNKIITNQVIMDGTVSSQYFSALMLIAPLLSQGLTINVKNNQISKSYIDMTIASMKDFQVLVENKNYKQYFIKRGQRYKPRSYQVEGDASGASYFWGIAAVTNSKIKVKNINPNSSQGDVKFPDLLEKMGCKITKNIEEDLIEVEGRKKLKSINVNMEEMPDTAQTLAVIAAFCQGKTKITGLSTLKVKETDRLTALNKELTKMGIKSKVGLDYIIVEGGNPKGTAIETYGDHRMAMAFALAGAKILGIKILKPEVVNKSFPEFWQKLKSLGVKIR